MASLRKRGRVWYYRFVDADGVRRSAKGCPDRRETEAMAAASEAEAAKIKAGLIDPRAILYRDHESQPLAVHLDDWRASIVGKGSGGKHAEKTRMRAGRVLSLGRIDRPSQLTPSRVHAALATLRTEGLSTETINHHVRAVKGFARWLWTDGRTDPRPPACVSVHHKPRSGADLHAPGPESRGSPPPRGSRRATPRGVGDDRPGSLRVVPSGAGDRVPGLGTGEPDPRVVRP